MGYYKGVNGFCNIYNSIALLFVGDLKLGEEIKAPPSEME